MEHQQCVNKQINRLRTLLNKQSEVGEKTFTAKEKISKLQFENRMHSESNSLQMTTIKTSIEGIENYSIKNQIEQENKKEKLIEHQIFMNNVVEAETLKIQNYEELMEQKVKLYKNRILQLKLQMINDKENFSKDSLLMKQYRDQQISVLRRQIFHDYTKQNLVEEKNSRYIKEIMNSIGKQQKQDQIIHQQLEELLHSLQKDVESLTKNQSKELKSNYQSLYKILEKTFELLEKND